MDVQDVRRIRDASERLMAAIDRAAPHLTYEELIRVGDQLEVVARALRASTAARPFEATAPGGAARERRSHDSRQDDR